jgi:hypothetical protein
MAENDKVTETLQINLEYESLLNSLKIVTNQYHSTIKQLSNFGSGVGKSFLNLHEQISSTLGTLSSTVTNKFDVAFKNVSKLIKNTQTETHSLAQQIERDLQKINEITEKRAQRKVAFETKQASIDELLKSGSISAKQAEMRKKYAAEFNEGIMKQWTTKEGELIQDLYKNISVHSANSIDTISRSSKLAASSIFSTVKQSTESLNNLRTKSVDISADVARLTSSKNVIKEQENLYKLSNKNLMDLDKQRGDAWRAVELAKLSVDKSTTAESMKLAEQNYQHTLREYNKINKLWETAAAKQAKFGRDIASTKSSIPVQTKGTSTDISTIFSAVSSGSKDLLSQSETHLKGMIQGLKSIGTAGTYNIEQLSSSFLDLSKKLDLNIVHLKEYENLMRQLGTVDSGALKIANDFRNTINSIEATKNKYLETAKLVSNLDLAGPLKKIQSTAGPTIASMDMLRGNIDKAYINMRKSMSLPSEDKAFDATKALDYWNAIDNAAKEHEKKAISIEKEITKLSLEEQQIRRKAAFETNEYNSQALLAYAEKINLYGNRMQSVLKSNRDEAKKTGTYYQEMKDFAVDFQASVAARAGKTGDWGNTSQIMDNLREKVRQVQRATHDLSASGRDAALSLEKEFQEVRNTFNNNRKAIADTIKVLERMGAEGLINTDKTVADLKKLQQEYKNLMNKVASESNTVARDLATQERKIEQTFFQRFWDGFNKLRWQVIATTYIFGMLASTIERVFVGNIEKVDEFRKSVYAVSSLIGMQLGKDFAANFQDVWNYSRDILERLQSRAASTYATLEDMTMVLRSVTQAGMFPKSDEDLDKITTLASAVKVMTEGMANSGVQMRQEITALIEGRQRVTDSVAMAFRLQGIDIKKEMAEWEKMGIDKLTGFAKLLEPFAEINRHITNEFGVQVNYLKEMWSFIKRIGLEDLTLNMARDINAFVKSLGEPGKFLTERGQAVASIIRSSFTGLYDISVSILKTLESIISSVSRWAMGMTGIKTDMSAVDKIGDPIAKFLMGLAYSITSIVGAIDIAMAGIRDILNTAGLMSVFDRLGESLQKALLYGFLKFLTKIAAMPVSVFSGQVIDTSAIVDSIRELDDEKYKIKDVFDDSETKKAIDRVKERLSNVAKDFTKEFGKSLSDANSRIIDFATLQGSVGTINKFIADMEKEQTKIQPKSEKYNEQSDEIKERIKVLEQLKDKTLAAANAQLIFYKSMEGFGDLPGFSEAIQTRIKELENLIPTTIETFATARKKADENLGYLAQKELRRMAEQFDQYVSFLEKTTNIDPWSKLEAQAMKYYADINKQIEEQNPYFIKNRKYIEELVAAWWNKETVNLMNKINDEIGDFQRKIKNVDSTELEKIKENYKNINREIEANTNLMEDQKKTLQEQVSLYEKIALQKKAIEGIRDAQIRYLESFEPQLKLMDQSVNFTDKQVASIARLTMEYQKDIITQAKAYDDMKIRFADNAEALKLINDAQVNYATGAMKLYTEQAKDILDPFYKDLKDMNQQWADEISSTLTDIIFNFKDWKTSITNLMQSMAKQVINAFIKEKLIKPLFDTMNNVGKEGESGAGLNTVGIAGGKFNPLMLLGSLSDKIFGKGAKSPAQSDIMTKMFSGFDPINGLKVYVTNLESLTGKAGGGLSEMFGGGSTREGMIEEGSDLISGKSTGTLSEYFSKFLSKDLMAKVVEESTKKGLDPNLVAAMIKQESSGYAGSISPKGALGLMQVMPGTARGLGYSSSDMMNPYKSIEAGTDYLKQQSDKFNGNVDLMLAAYNAGPGAVSQYGGIPPFKETQAYVPSIKAIMEKAGASFKTSTDTFKTSTDDFKSTGNVFEDMADKIFSTNTLTGKGGGKGGFGFDSLLGGGTSSMANPIPVYVTNMGDGLGGAGSTSDVASKLTEDNKSMLSGLWSNITGIFGNIFRNIDTMMGGLLGSMKGMFSQVSTMVTDLYSALSSGGGGGSSSGFGGLLGSLFGGSSSGGGGGGGSSAFEGSFASGSAYAEGGWLTEPIVGKGLRSGQSYTFGENESEWVIPKSKLNQTGVGGTTNSHNQNVNFTVAVNAIDTQSGVDFIMKNSKVYETMISKALKNNRGIRRDIKNSY